MIEDVLRQAEMFGRTARVDGDDVLGYGESNIGTAQFASVHVGIDPDGGSHLLRVPADYQELDGPPLGCFTESLQLHQVRVRTGPRAKLGTERFVIEIAIAKVPVTFPG